MRLPVTIWKKNPIDCSGDISFFLYISELLKVTIHLSEKNMYIEKNYGRCGCCRSRIDKAIKYKLPLEIYWLPLRSADPVHPHKIIYYNKI